MLISLLLTVNIFHNLLYCFYCWLWADIARLFNKIHVIIIGKFNKIHVIIIIHINNSYSTDNSFLNQHTLWCLVINFLAFLRAAIFVWLSLSILKPFASPSNWQCNTCASKTELILCYYQLSRYKFVIWVQPTFISGKIRDYS